MVAVYCKLLSQITFGVAEENKEGPKDRWEPSRYYNGVLSKRHRYTKLFG
jgi:hypothetical protein